MGLEWTLAFRQPDSHVWEQRKMLRRGIGPQRVGSHGEKIERNTTKLMLELDTFEGNPRSLISKSVPSIEPENNVVNTYPIDSFRKVDCIVVEVAYGKKVLEVIGEDLLSWNNEEMHLFDEAFLKFWFVDVFNFRASPLSLGTFRSMHAQFALYQVGFLVPSLGRSDPFIREIRRLMASTGELVNARPGCANKSDTRRSRKPRNFTCGTTQLHIFTIDDPHSRNPERLGTHSLPTFWMNLGRTVM